MKPDVIALKLLDSSNTSSLLYVFHRFVHVSSRATRFFTFLLNCISNETNPLMNPTSTKTASITDFISIPINEVVRCAKNHKTSKQSQLLTLELSWYPQSFSIIPLGQNPILFHPLLLSSNRTFPRRFLHPKRIAINANPMFPSPKQKPSLNFLLCYVFK